MTSAAIAEPAMNPPAFLDIPGCEFKPTSLELPEGLSFDHWDRIGRQLQLANIAVQWWIGDWLNYGEARYGEKYTQAVQELGRKKEVLMNYASVAKRVETSRRREVVDYSIHVEVASLPPKQQEKVLEKAAKAAEQQEPPTVREVRREVHRIKRQLGKEQSELELVHTPEVQEYLQRYLDALKQFEADVPVTAKFLRNMAQNHSAQVHWQKNRSLDDDCHIIHKVVKDAVTISEDDLFTWLIEHGFFMSDPELEERLEYMTGEDIKMLSWVDAGPDAKQDDRRGKLPQMLTLYFRKWDQGAKRNKEDDEDDF